MPHNILLIEDDPLDIKNVQQALTHASAGTFQLEWVRSCAGAIERLTRKEITKANGIAAVVVDLFLPDSQGIETFDRLLRAAPHVPILVLSAPRHKNIAQWAVQHGAQDYLLKARVDSHWLPKTLSGMLERAAIAEALFEEKERAQVTLNSVGDAVMGCEVRGNVTTATSPLKA
jgi:DNA-binding NarL/FixJ family response regulator